MTYVSEPASSIILAHSTCPLSRATWSGVHPSRSLSLGSTSSSSSSSSSSCERERERERGSDRYRELSRGFWLLGVFYLRALSVIVGAPTGLNSPSFSSLERSLASNSASPASAASWRGLRGYGGAGGKAHGQLRGIRERRGTRSGNRSAGNAGRISGSADRDTHKTPVTSSSSSLSNMCARSRSEMLLTRSSVRVELFLGLKASNPV